MLKNKIAGPVIVATVVLVAALLGIYSRPAGLLAAVWPANAALLGLMLRYPALSRPVCWVAAVAAYVAADMLTGGTLQRTLLLTSANMAGVGVGYILFRRLKSADLSLRRPTSIIYLVGIVTLASMSAGLIGAVAGPKLMGDGPLLGFAFWAVTEFANYVAVLPVFLSLPDFKAGQVPGANFQQTEIGKRYLWIPGAVFLATLAAGFEVGSLIAISIPVTALLLCALYYNVFTTSLFTLIYSVWALILLSFSQSIPMVADTSVYQIVLFRCGVSMITLAPLTVAIIMASRSELLNAAMLARKDAEEAWASRSLLLATMTHELRTPLNAIIGFSSAMEQEAFGPIGNKAYVEYSGSVKQGGEHLLALVNDLLDTAKIESGQYVVDLATANSGLIVQDAIRLVAGVAKEFDVKIAVTSTEWPGILADSRAIKQVLINLLSNAIKFSPAGSRVAIGSAIVGNRLEVSVQDNGSGISKEDLGLLGRPFTQAGNQSTQRQGTGLGLALSIQLVEQHGGTLKIASEIGKGTTVRFDLALDS